MNTSSCLFHYSKLVIVNCKEGIALVDLNFMELIHFYEEHNCILYIKSIFCDVNRFIYVLGKESEDDVYNLLKYKIKENNGEICEYKEMIESIMFPDKIMKVTCLNNGNYFIWGEKGELIFNKF